MTVPRRPRPAAPKLERYFTYRLNILNKLNDVAAQELYAEGSGVSLAEARCLAAIGSFPELTVVQLAYEANLDKGQASRAAQALVERGWVKKWACPVDKRSFKLSLTEEGQTRWIRHMQLVDQRNQQLLSCLSPEEQNLILDLMGRILHHAQK